MNSTSATKRQRKIIALVDAVTGAAVESVSLETKMSGLSAACLFIQNLASGLTFLDRDAAADWLESLAAAMRAGVDTEATKEKQTEAFNRLCAAHDRMSKGALHDLH